MRVRSDCSFSAIVMLETADVSTEDADDSVVLNKPRVFFFGWLKDPPRAKATGEKDLDPKVEDDATDAKH